MTDEELEECSRLCEALRSHRWPWEPLDALMGGSAKSQAARLGVDDRQIYRWRRAGGLTDSAADRCAITLGTHPGLVWPGWDDVGSRVGLDEVA